VGKIRLIKDSAEIEKIAAAVKLTRQAFTHILSFIEAGVPEHDLALEIEYFKKKKVLSPISFPLLLPPDKGRPCPTARRRKSF
jgi:Xaa-Pro aminopeptidase